MDERSVWHRVDLPFGRHAEYLDEALLRCLEIETADTLYGDIVATDSTWRHDLNVSYAVSEATTLHGGVRNVTAEKAFPTVGTYPPNSRGRIFYFGGIYRLQ